MKKIFLSGLLIVMIFSCSLGLSLSYLNITHRIGFPVGALPGYHKLIKPEKDIFVVGDFQFMF